MPLSLTTPPVGEPVSLSDAKTWLRVSHTEEDTLMSDLITSARERIEHHTGLALMTQSWRETLDAWPRHRLGAGGQAVRLARRPVLSVESVSTLDEQGQWVVWDPSEYRVEPGEPGRLIATLPFSLPQPAHCAGGLQIDFTAGFGGSANDVPAALREALLRMVGAAYANVERAESAQRGREDLPEGVEALLRPWRRARL